MCDICQDPQKAKRAAESMAKRLNELASCYIALSEGRIKPHTDAAQNVGLKAQSIIRDLVAEWL